MSVPSNTTNPVSQVPMGGVTTAAVLSALNVSLMTDGCIVQLNGTSVLGDGGGASYAFVGGSTAFIDGYNVVGTPTTGRWINEVNFSGVGTTWGSPLTVSTSGVGESLVVISGSSTQIIYTLPPSVTQIGKIITVKSIGTGSVQIRATGGDVLFDQNTITSAPTITFNNSGVAYRLAVGSGAYYRV